MGNIDTFVREIGKKTFDEEPFCDVDNLIVSYLVYYDFRQIVRPLGEDGSISVAEAAAQYKKLIGESQTNVRAILLEDMGKSVRYGSVRLSDRKDIFIKNKTQFSGLCVTLPDGTPYLVFRGVDNSITGWREAFQTSYMITPAQKMAVRYSREVLEKHFADNGAELMFGGHSKGGNLALYAAVHQRKKFRDRIRVIYQNDAPGMRPGSFSPDILHEFDGRVRRLAPEYSVIDCVYKRSQPTRIVKVDAQGFVQHEPFFWIVEGNDFTDGTADANALQLQTVLHKWIDSMKPKEAEQFIRRFFNILQKKADDQEAVDYTKAGSIVRLVLQSWTGASVPTKRAMLRLAGAFVSTDAQKRIEDRKKRKGQKADSDRMASE